MWERNNFFWPFEGKDFSVTVTRVARNYEFHLQGMETAWNLYQVKHLFPETYCQYFPAIPSFQECLKEFEAPVSNMNYF